jgi:hypothetical protein
MGGATSLETGGYRFLLSVFQYSAGVVAEPGYEIQRVRFRSLVSLDVGFNAIERFIRAAGRPITALCACELRSPAPFTDDGFHVFNEQYVSRLKAWGIMKGDVNPVARSNVCPEISPPSVPSFYGFSFTIKSSNVGPTFVVAGSGEAPEGVPGDYADRAIRKGETTPDAMREKACYVLGEMERRMNLLGCGWKSSTLVQLYTVHDFHCFFADEIVRRGAACNGATWHFARPPLRGLEYEMDCAGLRLETVIDATA